MLRKNATTANFAIQHVQDWQANCFQLLYIIYGSIITTFTNPCPQNWNFHLTQSPQRQTSGGNVRVGDSASKGQVGNPWSDFGYTIWQMIYGRYDHRRPVWGCHRICPQSQTNQKTIWICFFCIKWGNKNYSNMFCMVAAWSFTCRDKNLQVSKRKHWEHPIRQVDEGKPISCRCSSTYLYKSQINRIHKPSVDLKTLKEPNPGTSSLLHLKKDLIKQHLHELK